MTIFILELNRKRDSYYSNNFATKQMYIYYFITHTCMFANKV